MTNARYTIDCDILPKFSAAYLRVAGDECAFVETHTALAVPKLLAELEARGRKPEDVRWIVVTHAHLDHAGGAGTLLARCPNATLLAHPRAARHLIDPTKLVASATKVYGAARFATLYGTVEPIPQERVRALDDGATFDLGGCLFRVHHTAGHAKHHFVVHDPGLDTVYTGDTFGLVYPALQHNTRFALATTSPTDFDPVAARKSLDIVLALGAKTACLTHFGAVDDLAEVAAQVRAWVDRSEAWLEQSAAKDESPEAAAGWIRGALRAAIAEDAARRGLTFGESEWNVLATDIDLNAQGVAWSAHVRRHPRGA